ncbi:MAG: hydrogenase 4 subunit B [Gammaproteobacteria bacterium CG_4_10_14_0_8_um_filter_38_16]|nr:MAG: hydrogenase 4 subunit B [Gammaproteobacteria bacterium CG_4_10_14_0_8_um_filter_38_16]PJA03017.1 MAG: hydrogenase 4 subunit B [Gammaproteobacteria bacterium CG_4_10_14_0_2_um_filter_38_22]PJB10150.1 MAG: hydrogenase 4 subunit B [Gammaproteobacteria bacterium CG_4_9_14_3_um_filter_38_9]
MLSQFYHITLYACLFISLVSFLFLITKNNHALTFQRYLNTGLSLLIIVTGCIGFTTGQTLIIDLPHLFFIPKPSLYLNPISSFFIFLTGISYCGISFFSTTYFKHFSKIQQQRIHLFETIFVFSMLIVFTANDSFTFLFVWEVMALTSYFLVVSLEPSKQTRRAGFLYLGIAHVGFFAIVMSFYLLTSHANIFTIHLNEIASSLKLSQSLANTIFIFALIGFGAKAGFFPFHVWLPEAHPAAPSPISALMSGVMLKTAIYGLLRFSFDFLLPYQQLWWGYSLISLGLITMLVGVIHSAMQTDMKRLLAYSSMENIGIIATAMGFAIIFYQYGLYALSSLALLVVFLHCLNHSIFKSLLFLATGSILHATGERNLGKLGGLIHKMPWVSVCALIGTLSMAGLPLFNGFISEWLYLGIFFHHHPTPFLIAILSPLIIAISVLVFALAGFVAVKFYGIAFLGQPRESTLIQTYPSSWPERVGLLWLTFGCILLGLWANLVIRPIQLIIDRISQLNMAIYTKSIFLKFPPPTSHGFSPLLLCISLGALFIVVFILLKYLSPFSIRRVPSWNGGFNELNSHMQDTAEGFGQPFKRIFEKLISLKLSLPKTTDCNPHYRSELTEKIWNYFYFPLMNMLTRIAELTKWIQQGRMTTYLFFIGITLLVLLIWVVWS